MLAACLVLASALQEVAVAGPAPVPTPTPPPLTGEQIMQRVIARFDANRVAREGLEYRKTEVVSDLDGDPERPTVVETKRWGTWTMWIENQVIWQVKTTHNGRELRKQRPERPRVDMTHGIARFYEYSLGAPEQETVQGHPCWVILFTPHGRADTDGFDDAVSSRLAGTFWVDTQGFWIRKARAHLTESYAPASVLGTLYSAFFTMEQTEVLGAILPLNATLDLRYRKYLIGHFERYEYRYDEYRLRPQ
jgi:hypothetical protein